MLPAYHRPSAMTCSSHSSPHSSRYASSEALCGVSWALNEPPRTDSGIRLRVVRGFRIVFHENPSLICRGVSWSPWSAMYFEIVLSLSPIVELKYPTPQMLPLRYISRMNLNFFLKAMLVAHLIFFTTMATLVFGGISISR